jgi:hypothetical protein
MNSMKTYKGDPRKITVRFNSSCANCGCNLKRETTAYYWPHGKLVYCTNCGDPEFKDFQATVADEDV